MEKTKKYIVMRGNFTPYLSPEALLEFPTQQYDTHEEAEEAVKVWTQKWGHEFYFPNHMELRKKSYKNGVWVSFKLAIVDSYAHIGRTCAVMSTFLMDASGVHLWIDESKKKASETEVAWLPVMPIECD